MESTESNIIVEGHSGEDKQEPISYGLYVVVWLGLIALTSLTAVVAGFNFAAFTLVIALLIALTKASLVVNYFMHVKFEDKIFKVFLAIAGFTICVIFLLTFSDVYFRR